MLILKLPYRVMIDDFYIISIVSITLSSNIFFIVGNLAVKFRAWYMSRKAVAPLEVTSNETDNPFKKRVIMSEK